MASQNVVFDEFHLPFEMKSKIQNIRIGHDTKDEISLELEGNWQWSTGVEYKYHETMVHIPSAGARELNKVFIAGGGDGMALREFLKWKEIQSIDLCEIDEDMIRLFKDTPYLKRLNNSSLSDPRANIIIADAKRRLEETPDGTYDVIVLDYPSPDGLQEKVLAPLYSVASIETALKKLKRGGIMCIMSSLLIKYFLQTCTAILNMKHYVWHVQFSYSNSAFDSFLFASYNYPEKFRDITFCTKLISRRHCEAALHKDMIKTKLDLEHFMLFNLVEDEY